MSVHSQCGRNTVHVATLLQHLSAGLWEFEGQEAAHCQCSGGEQDGHSFSDPHKRRKDADAQHGGQFTQSVEETKGSGSERDTRPASMSV